MEPNPQSTLIAIARIVRTRGNRGELLAYLYTDFPERFRHLSEVWLEFRDRQMRRFELESCWEHKGMHVLKFAGIDSIGTAAELVGAWVKVEADKAVSLPEGTYYDHDLIGCAVLKADGQEIGIVRDVLRLPGNHQLVVLGSSGEYLVPAAVGICKEVRIEKRQILVELPEGLMDLNG